jgi:serine phosphatase RsbU (regulator of sigma subunit)
MSQHAEYFINNYLPQDYDGANTNYSIAQDNDGLIYVANLNGILVYNGVSWKLIRINSQEIRINSIYYADNQLYYGADNGDFGIIKKSKNGKFIPESFFGNLKEHQKPTEAIKQIVGLNGNIYFLSSDKLIELKDNMFSVYTPINSFHIRSLIMEDHLFLIDIDNSIVVLENGVLNPVANTEELARQKAYFSFKLTPTEYAIGFRNLGLYKVHYNKQAPIKTSFEKLDLPCNQELIDAEIVNGTVINGNQLVVTSNKKGAFLLNTKLEIINRFNTKNGVNDDNIKSAYQDKNGNLWFALNYGISFVELKSSLQRFTRKNGITGLVQSATYFNNQLYIATDKGVQYFDNKDGAFMDLNNFNLQSFYLLNYNNRLLIATANGLYIYDGKKITQASENTNSYYFILNDPHQPNLLYCGTDEGVDVFHYANNTMSYIKTYQLNNKVQSIACDYHKNIYFGTENSYVYFLNYKKSYLLDSITVKDGLPSLGENYVFTYRNKLLIGTDSSIYSVSNLKDKKYICKKDAQFYTFTKNKQIFRASGLQGDLILNCTYMSSKSNSTIKDFVYLKNNNGKTSILKSNLSQLKNVKANLISYDTLLNTLFIASDDGLFLLKKQDELIAKTYQLSIANIYSIENDILDTIAENITNSSTANLFTVSYSKNNLKIEPGYTCFENPNAIEFSYYLEGRDKGYSDWKKEKQFSYNNLSEGKYTFHLKARNEFTETVSEISFSFEISPPWYRSIWAYIAYAILFIGLMYVIVKFNTRRLKAQNIKLEGVITQRTAVIEEQVHLLEHQKQEITDSINYAQRIQQSILPSFNEINETYENGFIFFQPKDIVSGDFYWFHKISDSEFLLACADCTGHGVPGAFMSMICSDKLNEASLHTASPAELLSRANNAIKNVLKQHSQQDGTSKDGMEIALVKYNIETKQISYSGANRPLWLIKTNNKEFIEIKPTKASVASFTEYNFEYQQHELQLEKNDTIYLTSDGFPDQFGGPDGRKFMTKNMKTFLQEISDLPMSEQHQLIAKKINDWMGNLEQVDDLLVIGIKAN